MQHNPPGSGTGIPRIRRHGNHPRRARQQNPDHTPRNAPIKTVESRSKYRPNINVQLFFRIGSSRRGTEWLARTLGTEPPRSPFRGVEVAEMSRTILK